MPALPSDEMLRNIARVYAFGGSDSPIITQMPNGHINIRIGRNQEVTLDEHYYEILMDMVNELLAAQAPRRTQPATTAGFALGTIVSQSLPTYSVSREVRGGAIRQPIPRETANWALTPPPPDSLQEIIQRNVDVLRELDELVEEPKKEEAQAKSKRVLDL